MSSTTEALVNAKFAKFKYCDRKHGPSLAQMTEDILLLIATALSQVDEVVEPAKDATSKEPDKFSQGGWGVGGARIGQATSSLSNLGLTCKKFDRIINGSGLFFTLNTFHFREIERMTDYLTETFFERVRKIQSIELHLGDVFAATESHEALINCTSLRSLRIYLADLGNILGGTNEEFYSSIPIRTIFHLRGLESFEIVYDREEADDATYFHHGIGRVFGKDKDNDLVAVLHGVDKGAGDTGNGEEYGGLFDADKKRIPNEKNIGLRLDQINAYIRSVISSPRHAKWSPATFTREVTGERNHQIAVYKTAQDARNVTSNGMFIRENLVIDVSQDANIETVSDWPVTDLSEEEREWKITDNVNLLN